MPQHRVPTTYTILYSLSPITNMFTQGQPPLSC